MDLVLLIGFGMVRLRHAMLVDQKTEGVIVPLNEFLKSEGRLELANSKIHVHRLRDRLLIDICRRLIE